MLLRRSEQIFHLPTQHFNLQSSHILIKVCRLTNFPFTTYCLYPCFCYPVAFLCFCDFCFLCAISMTCVCSCNYSLTLKIWRPWFLASFLIITSIQHTIIHNFSSCSFSLVPCNPVVSYTLPLHDYQ